MPPARKSPARKSSDPEPVWWEWLEKRNVGTFGGIAIAAGEVVLIFVYWRGWWTLDVTFFVAVGWLTFILGLLSAYAAASQFFHRERAAKHRIFEPDWLNDVEVYFRWLTPVMFVVGIIFGHYFWH